MPVCIACLAGGLDFRKVLPSRLVGLRRSVYLWGFSPFQFFIVPLPKILASQLVASPLAALWEGGKFDKANSISGAMLNKFKRRRKIGGKGIFLLLLNLFNMAPEIEFASSNFPPSHKTASYAGYRLHATILASWKRLRTRTDRTTVPECIASLDDRQQCWQFSFVYTILQVLTTPNIVGLTICDLLRPFVWALRIIQKFIRIIEA